MEQSVTRQLVVGEAVAGHRILERLGQGGFGTVYRALDLDLQRPVALKLLSATDERLIARFYEEARLLARLNDPHVVHIYRVERLPSGQPLLTMELFGTGAVGRHLTRGEPAPPFVSVAVLRQALCGLKAAHEGGILHRDIKEANLLLEADSLRLKVCDFGIARTQDPLERGISATGHAVLGTPHYIAPERYLGQRADVRSDLYSLGVVFYRLLTGARPFESPGMGALEIAQRVCREEAPAPLGVPEVIAALCGRLLARDPQARFQSAARAIAALDRALADLDAAGPWGLAARVGARLASGLPPLGAEGAQQTGSVLSPSEVGAQIDAWPTGRAAPASQGAAHGAAAPSKTTVWPEGLRERLRAVPQGRARGGLEDARADAKIGAGAEIGVGAGVGAEVGAAQRSGAQRRSVRTYLKLLLLGTLVGVVGSSGWLWLRPDAPTPGPQTPPQEPPHRVQLGSPTGAAPDRAEVAGAEPEGLQRVEGGGEEPEGRAAAEEARRAARAVGQVGAARGEGEGASAEPRVVQRAGEAERAQAAGQAQTTRGRSAGSRGRAGAGQSGVRASRRAVAAPQPPDAGRPAEPSDPFIMPSP